MLKCLYDSWSERSQSNDEFEDYEENEVQETVKKTSYLIIIVLIFVQAIGLWFLYLD